MRKRLAQDGVALTERLCVYARYIDPEWVAQGVLDVVKTKYWSFIPRRGSGRTRGARDPRRSRGRRDRARARRRAPDRGRAHRAVRRDAPGGDRGHAPGRRRAARRAGGRHGDLRRQPQHQRLQRLHRRLRVLRLRPGQALARRLRARPRGVRARACARRSTTARPRSACSRASTPTGRSRTTCAGCAWPRRPAPQLHLHAYSPMEIAHMCDISGLPPGRGLRAAARRRPGLDAGHRRRGPARRRARAHQPQQAAGRALGGDHRGQPRRRAALDGDGDVRPHRGAVGAGRAHARGARAAGAHRRDHRVRAALVHPVPHAARAHARGRGDLARGEPQAHRRLPPRARAHDPQPAGVVGEDGPRRRDRGAVAGGSTTSAAR